MAEELQKYPRLYDKENKGYKKRDQKENAWRAVEQFLMVFFMNNKEAIHTYNKGTSHTFLFITFAQKFIIQITWNTILYHWHASPAINYGKLLVLFFFLIFPAPTSFSIFFWFAPDDSLRDNIKVTLMQIWNLSICSSSLKNNTPRVSHYNTVYFLTLFLTPTSFPL